MPKGDEPEFLWALIEGKVKKFKDGVGGRVQILRLINPGQYFGYRAHFAGERYVSSAATLEESVLGTIPMTLVDEMITKNNRLAMFFIHELSHNLGNSDTKIVNLTQKHIRARLAEALLVLRDNYGYEEDDNMTLKIYMAREDLANLSNMTTSNAIRTLSNFGSEKIIVVDGRKIKNPQRTAAAQNFKIRINIQTCDTHIRYNYILHYIICRIFYLSSILASPEQRLFQVCSHFGLTVASLFQLTYIM